MSYYKPETWSLRDVAKAFRTPETDNENPRIIVPIFQRGLRWDKEKRKEFIDSLERGYPFGSLLFAKQGENVYSVVDGLQRGSTICDFYYNPLSVDNINEIDDDVLTEIRLKIFPENQNHSINNKIKETILIYLHNKKTYDDLDYFQLAKELNSNFPNQGDPLDTVSSIQPILKQYFKGSQEKYKNICDAQIPVIVYSGPNEYMNEIFNRINVNGIPLSDYEIYAAIWNQNKATISNQDVVEKVVNKYMVLLKNSYAIDNFSPKEMLINKELTTFEFLFGLGKYWNDKYDCLKVESKAEDDEVNEVGFELIDACINDNRDIPNLDKILFEKYNVNKLQKRIEEAISFVESSIATVSHFKGNLRKYTVLHPKYQIISLISYTFREMYDVNNLNNHKSTWDANKKEIAKQLLAHYVADIISNEWHDGGRGKIFSANRERRYAETITKERWISLLDNYYQTQLSAKKRERFNNPTNADSVILNCVYNNIFTAGDQLSNKKFDIEHLATKEKMRTIMAPLDIGLPVSCIANQCYLPEGINRGKKEKTIYEANNMSMTIEEVEKKFSFTKREDFDWMQKSYDKSNQEELEKNFGKFLDDRFIIIKEKFLAMFDYDS